MKANELRIGNLIHSIDEDFNNELIVVDANDICNVDCEDDNDGYEPIPLTAEWLEKFGFNKFPNQKKYDMGNFWACGLRNGNEWHFEDLECIVKYVHQLQNLFFALTGEELAIKETTK